MSTAMDGAMYERVTSTSGDRFGRLKWAMSISLLLLAALAWWFWPNDLRQEIRDLPEGDRRAFVHRTVETLRTTCARTRGPDLSEYCRNQAGLVAGLDECDGECRSLVQRFARTPTR